jgi:hypothetical protein
VERIIGIGDISDQLANAFVKPGFSLVEVMEICTSYGVKSNPGMKLSKVVEDAGLPVKVYADRNLSGPVLEFAKDPKSLLESKVQIQVAHSHNLDRTVRIQIAGSAGEAVQSAAEKFAVAAVSSGLNATKKGSYPVTVGIGFSAADIILSPDKILYTGSPVPDILIITSEDGLAYARTALGNMQKGLVFIDESLPVPDAKATIIRHPFRETAGVKEAAKYSLTYVLQREGFFKVVNS